MSQNFSHYKGGRGGYKAPHQKYAKKQRYSPMARPKKEFESDQGYHRYTYWDPETCDMSFPDWVKEQWPDKDPAKRFLFDEYLCLAPRQCDYCRLNGRHIEYDENTDVTRVVFDVCQKCRYKNVDRKNNEYVLFVMNKDD